MSSEITPEDVASRSFGHTLRGYDPREVREYLDELADQLRRLRSQYLAGRQQLGQLDDHEVEAYIESATTEINEVLHAARSAAQQMRDRAARQAADTITSSDEAALASSTAAEADAYSMRQSAWETSTRMIEQVEEEVATLRAQADRDALAIVGEAEGTAHKKVAAARRDAEGSLRSARLEAERLLVDARAERDEMMAQANRATEAAQERTRALERRREELMAELEDLRLQREAPPEMPGRGAAPTVRVVEPGGGNDWSDDATGVVPAPVQHAPWADGSETVRLVDAPSEQDEEDELDADEIAGEVARRRQAEAEHALVDQPIPDEAMPEPLATPDPAAPELLPATDRDLAKAWSATDSRPADAGADDLGSLFQELRVDEPEEEAVTVPEAEPAQAAAPASEDTVTEETPVEVLLPAEEVTAFDLRDRSLLPIINRALRDVKRQLADAQNLQLDALKNDPGDWQPARSDLEERLSQELHLLQREAYVAGLGAAGEILGLADAPDRSKIPEGSSKPFISALFDEVVLTVQAGREAGHGARDLGGAVSRVYRVWRTGEAERRMRSLASTAYHNGLVHGYRTSGIDTVRIEVHESCGSCEARAKVGLSTTSTGVVPIHDECRCTILPG